MVLDTQKILELAQKIAQNADVDDCPTGACMVDFHLVDELRQALGYKQYTVGYKYGVRFNVRTSFVKVWASSIDDAKIAAVPAIRSTYHLQSHIASDTTPLEIMNIVETLL